MSIRNKTFTMLLLSVCFLLFFMGTASAANPGSSATATLAANATVSPSITPTPTATASPTPVPTPAPRQVFSSPNWVVDHETIVVKNDGANITVVAWIDDPSNSMNYSVNASETKTVATPSILAQDGEIVNFGFQAYENQTLIQSKKFAITLDLAATPTPLPPESVTISGTVVEAGNGAPIAGAEITFRPEAIDKTYGPVTTDSDGYFTSPRMYAGIKYTIDVTATGYRHNSSTTSDRITGNAMLSGIVLTKLGGGATPTPTPTPLPPSATPANPLDLLVPFLYNPALCIGTISSLVAVIAGSIGIYEWIERKRMSRVKKEKEDAAKSGEKKDEPSTGAEKKP